MFSLTEVRSENYRTGTLVFDQPLLQAKPGQFVMVWLPGLDEKPFSIASADPFSLTVTDVGFFSKDLCKLKAGERIWVRGPLGQGFKLTGKKHLLVGGGYGSVPLKFLAEQALAQGCQVSICLGAGKADDLLLADSFETMGCEVRLTTDDGSRGQKGLVTAAVKEALSSFQPDTLYACGPQAMLAALAALCREAGQSAQLSWEGLMRCGIGLCGSCELEEALCRQIGVPAGWLVCKDGPVSFLSPGNLK